MKTIKEEWTDFEMKLGKYHRGNVLSVVLFYGVRIETTRGRNFDTKYNKGPIEYFGYCVCMVSVIFGLGFFYIIMYLFLPF